MDGLSIFGRSAGACSAVGCWRSVVPRDSAGVWSKRSECEAGITFKKTLFATEQDRPAVARRRAQWRKYQGQLNPHRLVFVDETWASTNRTPVRSWSPRGHKLLAKVPHGRWKTMTFIAALRCDRIDAPYVLDGPINGLTFTAWVEQCLVPAPGDVVILDNLASHKGKAARQIIRTVSAKLLFLPPYSPDLNPIDPSTGSGGLRQAPAALAQSRRANVSASWQRIGSLLDRFPPQECANYLKDSDYAST